MKVYFGFTVAGDGSSLEIARQIAKTLGSLGHEVLTTHLLRDDAWEMDRRVTPAEAFQRDMKWLAECDLFIAEVSGSSFGLGFETGYLLGATNTKVVLFYQENLRAKLSLLITGLTHPNCQVVPYSNAEDAERWLRAQPLLVRL